MYTRKIKLTKSIAHKLTQLKSCLDMCCMPYTVHNGYIYIHKGKCTNEQVKAEVKRVLGV